MRIGRGECLANVPGPNGPRIFWHRLWKLPRLEPDCEDYGQAVIYKGSPQPLTAIGLKDVLLDAMSFFF